MSNPTTVIVVPPPPPRECIVVEGRRYCRDEEMSGRDVGFILLGTIGVLFWALWPLFAMHDHLEGWPKSRTIAWYGIPPTLLALALVLFGGAP